MDLSKAFDTPNHGLFIAKLQAYEFTRSSLKLLKSYLNNRWQRTKIGNTYSSWVELIKGVPQGSILGPLLFNIYLNDLFFINIKSDLCNFALVEKLESSAELSIRWFKDNYMKLNEAKCKLIISGNKHEVVIANVGNGKIYGIPQCNSIRYSY